MSDTTHMRFIKYEEVRNLCLNSSFPQDTTLKLRYLSRWFFYLRFPIYALSIQLIHQILRSSNTRHEMLHFRCSITVNIMERARRRRVYRPRKNPLLYFDDTDFVARYRLSKEIVRPLAARFAQSPFISTSGDNRGNGLHPEERVSEFISIYLVSPPSILEYIFHC